MGHKSPEKPSTDVMTQWLKSVIIDKLKGTDLQFLVEGKNKLIGKMPASVTDEANGTQTYIIRSPSEYSVAWKYIYNPRTTELYLDNLAFYLDAPPRYTELFKELFPRNVRPTRRWVSHDTVFIQQGYFMTMSGSTTQRKNGYEWVKVGDALMLELSRSTVAAAWYDWHVPEAVPSIIREAGTHILTVLQQISGEHRSYYNVDLTKEALLIERARKEYRDS